MNEHEKFAAELIERELARAGEVEPLAGLEERLLGKLEAERAPRRRWWWMAAPVAAALLFVALIYWRPTPQTPVVQVKDTPPTAESPAPSPVRPQTTASVATPVRPPRVTPLRTQPPVVAIASKQEVFPSPAALSAEEKVLVAFARRRPKEAEELAEQQTKPVERVTIAAIKIEPLVREEETNGIE